MAPRAKAASRNPLRPRALVPFAHVADVARSITFYEGLGFTVGATLPGAADGLDWAVLEHEGAQIMLARASAPVVAEEQAVLFYVYYDDVDAAHLALTAAGVECGPMLHPQHSPRGEFRVIDPDGYAIQVTHT